MKKGYTFIEILIGVTICAILITIISLILARVCQIAVVEVEGKEVFKGLQYVQKLRALVQQPKLILVCRALS